MTTLDALLTRSQKSNLNAFMADELYRLGYRSSKPEAVKEYAQAGRGDGEVRDAVAEAVADYQRTWMEDLEQLAGRSIDADGDAGPITLQHLLTRTCPVPDRMFAADGTPMEARWLDSCKDDLRWHVDYAGFSESTFGMSKEQTEAMFVKAFRDMAALFNVGTRRVESRGEALFTESFARLGGSTLGVHYLANNTCSPKSGRYNVMRWPSPEYFHQVVAHEITHGLGLGHVPGRNLMNPSIVWPLDGRIGGTAWTQRDIDAVLGLGYKRRTEPMPDPDPQPDPDDPTDPPGKNVRVRVELKDGRVLRAGDIKRVVTDIDLE